MFRTLLIVALAALSLGGRDSTTADTPEAIAPTREYIAAFDSEAGRTRVSDRLVARMTRRYPTLALRFIPTRAAAVAVPD